MFSRLDVVETIEEPFEWTVKFRYEGQAEGVHAGVVENSKIGGRHMHCAAKARYTPGEHPVTICLRKEEI